MAAAQAAKGEQNIAGLFDALKNQQREKDREVWRPPFATGTAVNYLSSPIGGATYSAAALGR